MYIHIHNAYVYVRSLLEIGVQFAAMYCYMPASRSSIQAPLRVFGVSGKQWKRGYGLKGSSVFRIESFRISKGLTHNRCSHVLFWYTASSETRARLTGITFVRTLRAFLLHVGSLQFGGLPNPKKPFMVAYYDLLTNLVIPRSP